MHFSETPAKREAFQSRETLNCPESPLGYWRSRENIDPGSPAVFLIPLDLEYPEFRELWRKYLFPHMKELNFDAFFLVENKTNTSIEEANDTVVFNVPPYSKPLWGHYFRTVFGLEVGLRMATKYEWFIRPDTDAFYCLHHIRLEMNELELRDRPNKDTKPGIHWSHYYGDGAGGQPGPPISDVHEVYNRHAAIQVAKNGKQFIHDGIWDYEAADVYAADVSDLSPTVTQVHDIRWAYYAAPNQTLWNTGFLGIDFATECFCANWLAIHLRKQSLGTKFERLATLAEVSQKKGLRFDKQFPPPGAKFGFAAPYNPSGFCSKKSKRLWPGCANHDYHSMGN